MYVVLFIILFVWIIKLSNRVAFLEKSANAQPQQAQSQQSAAKPQASLYGDPAASALLPGVAPTAGQPVQMDQAVAAAPVMAAAAPSIEKLEKEDSEFVWAKYLARAGIAAILLGVAFFLKLAIDAGWIGVMARVALGIAAGVACLVIGQVLRSKYKSYSDVLIGGGLGILYVTVFFANYFYHLISNPVALGLMVGITALGVVMSVIDKAESLARIGIIGGFLAPILISIENAGVFDLFTYALILDIGVLVTALSQRWHKLNFIAFVGTFVLYALALAQSFEESMRVPVLMYTTLFFGIFLAVSIMHHIVRKEKTGASDVLLITLNAIWYGVAVYGLVEPIARDFLGFYMLGIALIYAAVALVSFHIDKSDRMLNQYLTGLCVVFLTAAIPMQFDGSWITIMWFLEAVILFAIDHSLRGKNLYPLGSVVFILGVFRYFTIDKFEQVDYATFSAVMNSRFFMLLAIIVAAITLGYIAKRAFVSFSSAPLVPEEGITDADVSNMKSVGTFFFVVANILSIYLITTEVSHKYEKDIRAVRETYASKIQTNEQYQGVEGSFVLNDGIRVESYDKTSSIENQRNVAISIAWAIYAAALLIFGFVHKSRGFRIAGLAFIFITLVKVFFDIWNFGGIYRVIGSVAVGIIALLGSFLYAKYKDRIRGALIAGLVGLMVLGVSGGLMGVIGIKNAEANVPSLPPSDAMFLKYTAPINTGNASGPVTFDIPASALSKTSINDIRLYDDARMIVPYVILDGDLTTGASSISAAVSNSTVRGGESAAILDLGQTGTIHDSVTLDVTGADSFTRTVSIYGADSQLPVDSSAWRTITSSGYIYSYMDGRAGLSARNTLVQYPKNSSRYLKVVISADAANKSPLAISGARIMTVPAVYSMRTIKTAQIVPTHISVLENASEKTTEITIDLGSSGIFSHQLTLATSDESQQFIRRAVIQQMNSSDADISSGNWSLLGEANLFNIDQPLFTGSNLTIAYPETRARFLRVIVFNKDDRPVAFSKNSNDLQIVSKIRSVLFDANAGKTYSVYFGNPTASKPQYDFASIKAYQDLSPQSATLGAIFENVGYVAPKEAELPWGEDNKVLLNVALVLLVIVAGGIVYMYVRKVKGTIPADVGTNEPAA